MDDTGAVNEGGASGSGTQGPPNPRGGYHDMVQRLTGSMFPNMFNVPADSHGASSLIGRVVPPSTTVRGNLIGTVDDRRIADAMDAYIPGVPPSGAVMSGLYVDAPAPQSDESPPARWSRTTRRGGQNLRDATAQATVIGS